jgi:hypothetical protein
MEANLHSVAMAAGVLAIRCNECGNRVVLGKDRLPIFRGNMTPLSSLKFACSACKGDKGFALYIPFDQAEVDAFLRGVDLDHRHA